MFTNFVYLKRMGKKNTNKQLCQPFNHIKSVKSFKRLLTWCAKWQFTTACMNSYDINHQIGSE